MMKTLRFRVIKNTLTFVILVLTGCVFAQDFNPPYPRIGSFQWGGARPEWYARFDMLIFGGTSEYARAVKEINSAVQILPTIDWNAGAFFSSSLPDEWKVYDSSGEAVAIYGSRNRLLANMTSYCQRSDGKTYNEALAERYSNFDWTIYDGVSTDGLWIKPWGVYNVDFDRNGVNDFSEHGSDWVYSVWHDGIESTISGVREAIPNNKIMLINTGGSMTDFKSLVNGHMVEKWYTWGFNTWAEWWNDYNSWTRNGQKPSTYYLNGSGEFTGSRSKTDYRLVRFGLTSSLLGDGYYDYHGATEHYYDDYYDEYEVQLGYPTSDAQSVANNVYVRFFDNGVSIVNGNDYNVNVTDSDLASLSGYAGPYYRFKGNQAPEINNGELFTSIELLGSQTSNGKVFGDGIVLINPPSKSIVTDIYLDNAELPTLAGQEPAVFEGTWNSGDDPMNSDDPAIDNPSWTIGPRWCNTTEAAVTYLRYKWVDGGTGSKKATYNIEINVSGIYDIYEWHGWVGESEGFYTEATNVPYEITHAVGKTSGTINQQQNAGQWILLGSFNFLAGGTDYKIVLNNNANGAVIADAFKLVYSAANSDDVPPNEPRELKSDSKTEHSIDLSWLPSLEASDNDVATAYEIYRDGTYLGLVTSTSYSDISLNENTSYTYSVYAVDDVGNKSLSPVTVSITTLADATAPVISSVVAVSPTQTDIVFSERVEITSAQNSENYLIDNSIVISQAVLDDNQTTVHLTTSTHAIGTMYTIRISNVKDLASTANVIAANSSAVYFGIKEAVSITNISRTGYGLGNIAEGNQYYGDRDFTVTVLPEIFDGLLMLKTLNDDKTNTQSDFLSFELNQEATVFIAYDSRVQTPPDWLTSDFAKTNYPIFVSDEAQELDVWQKTFSAGTVALGGNAANGFSAADQYSMYSVFVKGTDGDTEPPSPPVGLKIY